MRNTQIPIDIYIWTPLSYADARRSLILYVTTNTDRIACGFNWFKRPSVRSKKALDSLVNIHIILV